MTLEDVKVSLDNNVNLDDEIRNSIYGLVDLFHRIYPNVELTNLCNNLKTLQIKKSSKFINKKVSRYDFRNNVLEFNVEKINEGYDMKHILMYELLNIITNNGKMTGFNEDDEFRALNAGYTEIITNNLVGNESDISYLDEEIIYANMVSFLVGNDIIFNAYFNNDLNSLLNALKEKGFDK